MLVSAQFSGSELLSLIGLIQSVYVLVYMLFRSGSFRNAIIPSLYFVTLGFAFLFDAAAGRWSDGVRYYELFQWFFWISGLPIGTLMLFQLATIGAQLRPSYLLLLLLIPLSFSPVLFTEDVSVVYVGGLVAGALSLLAVWLRRDLIDGLHKNPRFGEERFWLIMSLIILNTAFLGSTLASISHAIAPEQWILIRTLLGIAFVYISGTSLFRIYPQFFKKSENATAPSPTSADKALLDKLSILIEQDKVYQEPNYGRAELAREMGVGEATLSKLVNIYYNKTIPQLLNELRVRDASRLLKETDVPIQMVFEESGFNSITTFNRVFKELTGDAPKEHRLRFRT